MNTLLNHLWQSTVFAAGIFVICHFLRQNSARTRYWLWFAASMKFLVPFSLLISLGTRVDNPRRAPIAAASTVEQISFSFSPMTQAVPSTAPAENPWPVVLAVVWVTGSLALLLRWFRRWRTIHNAAQNAEELPLRQALPVLASPGALEPGIFGVFRPVLLLPQGLWSRLSPEQFHAVLVHELCHLRCRDNLTAALHMCVEALFWFHPLVWWLGNRLVDERERACDEAVLAAGGEPEVYAAGIVNVCKYFIASPIPCAAGVSGADLRQRIARIMLFRVPLQLTAGRRVFLAAFFMIAVVFPFLVGMLRAQAGVEYRFEVASIRPAAPGYGNSTSINTTESRLTTRNTSLFSLITFAYGVQPYQIEGVPAWARDERYDIAATYDTAEEVAGSSVAHQRESDRVKARLRNLLSERFHLKLRKETRELPLFALIQDRGGHKLKPAPTGSGSMNINRSNGNGTLHGDGVSTESLAHSLGGLVERPVVDETGLTDRYLMQMTWSSEGAADGIHAIVTALREQLGLKLHAKKGPLVTYVIESVDRPSEN